MPSPVALHRLVILHEGEDVWANEVAQAVAEIAEEVTQRSDLVERCPLDDALSDPISPGLVVVLANAAAGTSAQLAGDVERARTGSLAVLPITRSLVGVGAMLPESLQVINALAWNDPAEAAHRIAALLGLVEDERKLFLSYRRFEAEGLALQLRRALADRQFDVFLDRFSVPPGVDFQERLTEELADKSFVLLLETRTAQNSDWVQWEVSYAIDHHIPVLALSFPGADPDGKFSVLDDAFRLPIEDHDLTEPMSATSELTASSLSSVLQAVEAHAARGLRRRRAQLLTSTDMALMSARIKRRPLDGWALLAEPTGMAPIAYLITPRAPIPSDLRALDRIRIDTGLANCEGRLVHNTVDRDPTVAELLEWVAADRPLETISVAALTAELLP
jgi:hypothetical protein